MSEIRWLRRVAALLALVVAAIHLYWGVPKLVVYLAVPSMPDPRPPLFVLSAMAIIMGVTLVMDGVNPRPIYLGGMVLVVTFLVGYAAWHTVLGHGAFWPWGPGGHHHGGNPITVVAEHLLYDRLALISKVVELVLLIVLGVLYRLDR